MVQSTSLVLAKNPVGLPIAGADLIIKSTELDITATPPSGTALLKTNFISYDPYLRGYMNAAGSRYVAGYVLDEPLDNNASSTGVSSSNPRFNKGDVVIGNVKFSVYQIVGKERADKEETSGGRNILNNPLRLDEVLYLGALDMSGLTAHSSFYEIGQPEEGRRDVYFCC